jgi:hypothetical protein
VLLVYRVDRFFLLPDLLDLLGQLDDAGWRSCRLPNHFDTSAAIGQMPVQLLGVFA